MEICSLQFQIFKSKAYTWGVSVYSHKSRNYVLVTCIHLPSSKLHVCNRPVRKLKVSRK